MALELDKPSRKDGRGSILTSCAKWGVFELLASLLWAGGTFAYGVFSAWRDHQQAIADVSAEVSRIRAAGQPISPSKLDEWRRLPVEVSDSTDAWLVALKSFDRDQFELDGGELPYVGAGKISTLRPEADGNHLEEAKSFLKKYESTLRATIAATQQPGEPRYPVEFDMGEDAVLPLGRELRSLERLLRLNAHVCAVHGDSDQAMESLLSVVAVAASMNHQASLSEFGLQQAVLSVALLEAEWLLSNVEFNEEQLAALQSKVESFNAPSGLTRALIGQRAITFSWLYAESGLQGATSKSFLDLMSQFIDASRKPLPEAIASAHNVRDTLASRMNTVPRWQKRQLATATSAAKNYCKAFDFQGTTAVHPVLVAVVIAAERYRLKWGEFPENLDDLVPDYLPAAPHDLFDNRPLRIYSRDGKFAVYSIGVDREDNGGKDNLGFGKPDIVVRHLPPQKRPPATDKVP